MRYLILMVTLSVTILSGCAGLNTFPVSARSGDTIAIPAGWKQSFGSDTVTVTIMDSLGAVTIYSPGNSAIRAVTNFYLDPLSKMMIDNRLGSGTGVSYGGNINLFYTGDDNDWWQTMVFLDLPTGMEPGAATVVISEVGGESHSVALNVLTGTGSFDEFRHDFFGGALTGVELPHLERVPHFTINFATTTSIPHAVDLVLAHDTGVGTPIAVNPRGEIKSMNWSDDGSSMHVIMMRSNDAVVQKINDFKVYVAGGISGVSISSMQAFDENGAVLSGVTATCAECL